ncbi:hypothetical protein SAMN04488109_1795 [Chryseolinea serpens]|uniref:Uncharacterized protein n=1 Tax=Chryseolinea serpens TaxID=947013 RepID=A0A1M5MK34_9BACT|nr:hypothetical protein SAMN04488109_1795 [Chryseolinea serpens]
MRNGLIMGSRKKVFTGPGISTTHPIVISPVFGLVNLQPSCRLTCCNSFKRESHRYLSPLAACLLMFHSIFKRPLLNYQKNLASEYSSSRAGGSKIRNGLSPIVPLRSLPLRPLTNFFPWLRRPSIMEVSVPLRNVCVRAFLFYLAR